MRGNLPDPQEVMQTRPPASGGGRVTRAAVARLSYRWAPDAPPRRRPRLPARRARRHGVRAQPTARARAPESDERPGLGRQELGARGRPRPRLPGLRDQEHDAHRRRRPDRQRGRRRARRLPRHHAREPPRRRRADRRARLARRHRRRRPRLDAGARRRSCSPTGPTCRPPARDALAALRPLGAKAAGGAQVVRVGDVARPPGLRTTDIAGRDPFALARALDAFQTAARGKSSDRVLVVSADDPAFAMPAAAWAAKAGDPVLFVHRDSVPQETKAALLAHDQPRIYVLGPPSTVSASVATELKKLGTVKRLGADNPIDNAIAFARYSDPTFGWGVVDPGHGLVFARSDRPLDAAAAVAALGQRLLRPAAPARLPHRARRRGRPVPARHPARLHPRSRARRLQSRLDRGRRSRHLRGDAGPHRLPPGDQEGPDQPGAVQQPVSEAESPIRKAPGHEVTVDDVRQLMGASTPHFALQIRNRIARLIARPARGPPRPDRGRARDRAPARAGLRSASSAASPTRTASSRCPRWTTDAAVALATVVRTAPADRIAARSGIMRARVARPRGHRPRRGGACLARAHAVAPAGAGRVQPALVVDARRRRRLQRRRSAALGAVRREPDQAADRGAARGARARRGRRRARPARPRRSRRASAPTWRGPPRRPGRPPPSAR